MKYKTAAGAAWICLLVSGCSNDYEPPATAGGEEIFMAVCAECHTSHTDKPVNMFFTLEQKNAKQQYIAEKISSGGLSMPKFPNIKGEKMDLLTQYVLEHSLRK